MRANRYPSAVVIATLTLGGVLCGQPQNKPIKRPKNNELILEAAATSAAREPESTPTAGGAADRLVFHTSPMSGVGLLSEQVREALKALDRANGNATFLKLRAFVAGPGDLRRVQSIAAEVFSAKKLPIPVVTSVRVGNLGVENAQVVIESISEEKKPVNPNGLLFYTGQRAGSGSEAVETIAQMAVRDKAEVAQITCFADSLEQASAAGSGASRLFPKAAGVFLQASRFGVDATVHCDAIARASATTPAGTPASSGKLIFSTAQMAFGSQASDVQLALDRIRQSVAAGDGDLAKVRAVHVYATNRESADLAAQVMKVFGTVQITVQIIEALPSLDGTVAIEMVVNGK